MQVCYQELCELELTRNVSGQPDQLGTPDLASSHAVDDTPLPQALPPDLVDEKGISRSQITTTAYHDLFIGSPKQNAKPLNPRSKIAT